MSTTSSTSSTQISSPELPIPRVHRAPSPEHLLSFPASVHAAVLGGLAAIILPISLAPYFLIRRRLSSLQRKFNELESVSKALRQESQEHSVVSTRAGTTFAVERRRMNAQMQDVKQEFLEARGSLDMAQMKIEKLEGLSEETERRDQIVQSELHRLIEEARIARTQGDALRSLGPSLADIAAFMHEVELWMPEVEGSRARINDKTRVEQLRLLALMLQNLPRQKSTPPC